MKSTLKGIIMIFAAEARRITNSVRVITFAGPTLFENIMSVLSKGIEDAAKEGDNEVELRIHHIPCEWKDIVMNVDVLRHYGFYAKARYFENTHSSTIVVRW